MYIGEQRIAVYVTSVIASSFGHSHPPYPEATNSPALSRLLFAPRTLPQSQDTVKVVTGVYIPRFSCEGRCILAFTPIHKYLLVTSSNQGLFTFSLLWMENCFLIVTFSIIRGL